MSSLSQTVLRKNRLARLKQAGQGVLRYVSAAGGRRRGVRQCSLVALAVLILAAAVQFAAIPLSDIVLEVIYPPVKEKKLFGLYESTKADERLELRKGQTRVAWWLLFSGTLAGGGWLVLPRLRSRSKIDGELVDRGQESFARGGRYRIHVEIGRGAMGVVYSAYDTVLQRDVAVKELPESLLRDAERRERFKREALTLAQLSHKGIVNIYDLIEDHDRMMLVMELVEGGSLEQLLVPGVPMALNDAAQLTIEMAEALAYIHSREIVHRDLKPANVLIDASGSLKITDFGLARLCQDSSLTLAGSVIGSPLYMSPEQAVGRKADHRADIYALGIIFYQLLTGAPPFEGDHQEVMSQHLSVAPAPLKPQGQSIPAAVDTLLMCMLEKVVDDRLGSCAEIIEVLRPFTHETLNPLGGPQ